MSDRFPPARQGGYLPAARISGAMLVFCIAVAARQSGAPEWFASATAAEKVAIKLTGEVARACAVNHVEGTEVASIGSASLTDVTRSGRKDFNFVVNCNTPFQYRLEAKYGALTNVAAEAAPGFKTSVSYDVRVHIPTDGAPIDDRCSGSAIQEGRVTCPFSTSGNNIALNSRARLSLAWRTEAEDFVAGQYSDSIRFVIAPKQ